MMNLMMKLFHAIVDVNYERFGNQYRDYGSVQLYIIFELVIFSLTILSVLAYLWCYWRDIAKKRRERKARKMERKLGDAEVMFLYRYAEADHRMTQNALWFELMAQYTPRLAVFEDGLES